MLSAVGRWTFGVCSPPSFLLRPLPFALRSPHRTLNSQLLAIISDMIPIIPRSLILAVIALSLVFASLATPQHAPVQPSPDDVIVPANGDWAPMLDFGGRPVVPVMINGKGPYKFIFDTGASVNVVDTSVAAELSLDSNAKIQEVRLGDVRIRNVQAFVNPISQMLGSGDVPRGVLSASSFPGNLVIFDFPAKRVVFRNG